MARNGSVRTAPLLLLMAAATALGGSAAVAAEPDVGPSYGDLGQALMLLIVFAIVVFVLGRYAWRPIIEQLNRRQEEIAGRIRDSERRQREAEELEQDYRARLERVEQEARQIIAKGLQEAAKAREQVLEGARGERDKVLETAKAEIEQLKDAALRDVQKAVAGLAVDVAGQVLREELTAEGRQRLMRESLRRIRDRVAGDAR